MIGAATFPFSVFAFLSATSAQFLRTSPEGRVSVIPSSVMAPTSTQDAPGAVPGVEGSAVPLGAVKNIPVAFPAPINTSDIFLSPLLYDSSCISTDSL